MSSSEKSLDELRVGIDAVDRQLVAAINKRSELTIELARLGRRLERVDADSGDQPAPTAFAAVRCTGTADR